VELDGRVITEEAWKSIGSKGFDPQESFAAFYNTLRWHCVTATDPAHSAIAFSRGDPFSEFFYLLTEEQMTKNWKFLKAPPALLLRRIGKIRRAQRINRSGKRCSIT